MYHRVTWKDYETKECVHESKEGVKEQYSTANIDVWIRDLDTIVTSVCCGNYLSERSM